jgi:two-component system, cell cycle sensor histidine kinase and response regulator CckA
MMSQKPTYEELEQRVRELEKSESLQRDAEEALQRSERQKNLILNVTSEMAAYYDTELRIIWVNRAAAESVGKSPEEMVGLHCYTIWNQSHGPCADCPVIEARNEKVFKQTERQTPDGRHWNIRGYPILDKQNNVIALAEFTQDITERKKTEAALIESEQKWRNILINTPQIGISLDSDGRIVFANKHFLQLTGWMDKDVLGQDWFDMFIPPEIRQDIRQVFQQVMSSGSTLGFSNYENEILTRNGERLNIAWSNVITKNPDGNIVDVTCFGIDLTERRKAEKALLRSKTMLARTEHIANIGSWEWEIASDKVTWSNELFNIFRLDPAQEAPSWAQHHPLYHPEDMERLNQAVQKAASDGTPYELELRGVRKDGRHILCLARGFAENGPDGRPVRLYGSLQDITERKRAEEALKAAEETYRNIFLNSHVGLYRTDIRTGMLLDANDAVAHFFGYEDREELLAEPFNISDRYVDPADREKMLSLLRSHGEFINFEARFTKKDGTTSLHRFSGRMRPEKGWIEGVSEDITEPRRVEEERAKLREQLAQSQKLEAIGSLAGGVAHDLNNLLSPILGYGEMLRDDLDLEDARRESVEEIMSAGLRARDLVRQLLAFSRKQILEFKPVDLSRAAAGLRKLLRHTIREDIEVEFDLSPAAAVVMADIGQIEQVIINLSVNAADAMPEGGKLTVETGHAYLDEEYAKRHKGMEPGEYVMLAVSDSGVGMDEATRERIFDPFFSTKGEHGTGLGLATVYGIVKQHGGNIWVYSEPGKGSTFKVYLPLVEASKAKASTPAKTGGELKGSETVLIVEDSDQVRRLAESILKRNGYRVMTARDGNEALGAMASHGQPLHLLLTDVVLPGMNGRELYEKAAEAFPSMKVLYMSGYTDNVIAHSGVLDEGVQFIQKPFTVYGLAAKIREVLDGKPRPPEPGPPSVGLRAMARAGSRK